MLFGEKTRPIADFLPRVLAHIDGIDVDMATTYTMDAAIQFIRDTKILTEIVCFDLDDCTFSYKLTTKRRITEVIAVRFFINGRQQPNHGFAYRIEGDVFYLDTIPHCAHQASVEVELSVAPARDSYELPDWLYEDWVDAVTALTLSRLYLLTDNEWYNPQAAANQYSQYQQFARQARFTKVTKHKPFNMRLANTRRL